MVNSDNDHCHVKLIYRQSQRTEVVTIITGTQRKQISKKDHALKGLGIWLGLNCVTAVHIFDVYITAFMLLSASLQQLCFLHTYNVSPTEEECPPRSV